MLYYATPNQFKQQNHIAKVTDAPIFELDRKSK